MQLSRFSFLCVVLFTFCSLQTCSAQSAGSALAQKLQQLKSTHAGAGGAAGRTVANSPAYEKMLTGVALIQCTTDDATTSGTGWVVDAEQRLLVTNHHVIDGFLDCWIYFPLYVDGHLVTNPAEALSPERALAARVVDVAINYDLALLQLEGPLPEGIVALDIADAPASPGDTIHSVAGSTVGSQSLWVYSTGHVRQTVRGLMANDYEANLLESDMATNQGNSGGPVCNDSGQVVAVVEGHRTDARLVSIYVSLESLAEYLSDALRCVNPETVEDLQFAAQRQLNDYRSSVALQHVNRALNLEPDSASLLAMRGWCWYFDGDADSARADFEEAIENDRKFADAHSGLGYLAVGENDHETAIKHFTDAVRNDPGNVEYLVQRGKSHFALEDYDAAYRDFNKAIATQSDYMDAIVNRGYASIELGNQDQGLADLELVVDYFTEDPQIFDYYGRACLMNENYEDAVKFFSHSLTLDPEYETALFGLGLTFLEMSQAEDAGEPLAKALELNPNSASYQFFYGIQQLTVGVPSGLDYVARAVELAPQDESMRNTYQELKANLGQTQQNQFVAKQVIPEKYVGVWYGKVSGNGRSVEFHLTLNEDGTYINQVIGTSATAPRLDQTENGRFTVDGDEAIVFSDETSEYRMPIKWQGSYFQAYIQEIGVWLILSKTR
ncbi:MAG: trypsin-like peptidase domain-containing protein [Planctomycetales bacterium]|nr:trypsin-like peptidase domain-containing protein [Planctomycetales bacterium]